MSGRARRGRGTPCEPCMLGRLFPEKVTEHGCTGQAAFSDGSVPCPCCGGTVTPMLFCRRCDLPIRPGHGTRLTQSASSGNGATNHVHTQCPPPMPKVTS